jgi:1,4-alpha-glucan branching enzyme
MLRKTYSKTGRMCRVTFVLPADVGAETVVLCGDFNNWDRTAHTLTRRKDGRFSLTLSLTTGRQYHYRYLLDGRRWENDWEADGYSPNPFGSEDSLLEL